MSTQSTPTPSTHIARTKVYEHTMLDSDGNPMDTVNYTLSPINLSILAELEDYLRGEVLSVIETQLIGKPVLIQEIIVAKALELGDKRRIGTVEFDRAVQTINGIAYLLFLSIRTKHSEFTPALGKKVLSEANTAGKQEKLVSALYAVTGFATGKGSGQVTSPIALTANP